MNEITVSGTLKKDGSKYKPGCLYWLDVMRKSGVIDKIMVFSRDENLMEGDVLITGCVKAEYIQGLGVPVFIVPDSIEPMQDDKNRISEVTVLGILKADPVLRTIKSGKYISTIILMTAEGPVPILLWNGNAKIASETYKAGDMLKVTGRLQSREYSDRKGKKHTTYELSAHKIKLA